MKDEELQPVERMRLEGFKLAMRTGVRLTPNQIQELISTIEALQGEVARYRKALEYYDEWVDWEDESMADTARKALNPDPKP